MPERPPRNANAASFLSDLVFFFSRAFRPAIPWFRALQLAPAAARRAFRPVAFSRARFRRDFAEAIAFGSGPSALPPARLQRRNDGRPASFARAGSFRFRPASRTPPRSAKRRGSRSRRFWNPRARASAICQSSQGSFWVCPSVNAARLPAAPRRARGGFGRAFDPGLRGSPSEVARARLGSICRTIRGARAGERPRTWCCRLGR